jgi:hypothetical protein
MKECKNACNKEIRFLKKILENKLLVKTVKKDLTKMIYKMEKLGVDMETLLSDAVFTGNIGKSNDKKENKKRIEYIKSDESTIREKVAAISNSFWDASVETPRYKNCELYYQYIMQNRNRANCKALYESIQVITKNKNPEKLDSSHKNISTLWCPLFYLFPGYNFKKYTIPLHDLKDKKMGRSLKKEDMIEPLSEYENQFYKSKDISINNTIMDVETGRDKYRNTLCRPFNYNNNTKFNCRVAGVSGHAITHLTLGFILNINLKSVFIGQMLEMVPMHHSIEEICFGMNDFNYFLKCHNVPNVIKMKLFDNHSEMLHFIKKHILTSNVQRIRAASTKKKRVQNSHSKTLKVTK